MINTTNAWVMMNRVDYNLQALHLKQGFGFAYTFLNKQKMEG